VAGTPGRELIEIYMIGDLKMFVRMEDADNYEKLS